jgi:hypothetical protein
LPADESGCDSKVEIEVRAGEKENLRLLVIKAANKKKQPQGAQPQGAQPQGGAPSEPVWEPAYPPLDKCGDAQLKFKTRHRLPDGTNLDSDWIDLTEDRIFTPHDTDQLYVREEGKAKGNEPKCLQELEYLIFKNGSDQNIDKIEVFVARGKVEPVAE